MLSAGWSVQIAKHSFPSMMRAASRKVTFFTNGLSASRTASPLWMTSHVPLFQPALNTRCRDILPANRSPGLLDLMPGHHSTRDCKSDGHCQDHRPSSVFDKGSKVSKISARWVLHASSNLSSTLTNSTLTNPSSSSFGGKWMRQFQRACHLWQRDVDPILRS